jgi:hypothetical protein
MPTPTQIFLSKTDMAHIPFGSDNAHSSIVFDAAVEREKNVVMNKKRGCDFLRGPACGHVAVL